MSTLKIDELKNNGSAIDLPNGIKVGGNEIVQGYTSSGTEPASPATGDFWWDSTNELLYQYVNGEFKAIGIVAPNVTLDISSFSYDNVSLGLFNDAASVSFSDDGTKLFWHEYATTTAHQYSLSTGFDLTTATNDSVSFSFTGQTSQLSHVSFSTDGTKMFSLSYGTGAMYQYSLSTAWDLSTASYASISKSTGVSEPWGLTFSPDGTKMFIVNFGGNAYEYTLSTPFQINTASLTYTFSIGGQDSLPRTISFNANGTQMYAGGSVTSSIFQYSLTTAFDLSTASYDGLSFNLSAQVGTLQSTTFSASNDKLYATSSVPNSIFQYSTNN